jgi:hypothetical protein
MRVHRMLAQFTALALWLTVPTNAMSGPASVNFRIALLGHVDCYRPFAINNIPITASGSGAIYSDGSGEADLTQTAFILSSTIHFEGRLGRPTAAPGGTAQMRVIGRHRLLLTWDLPNNLLVVTVNVTGSTCSASIVANLKPRKTEYTLFDGTIYHYCGRPITVSSSCEVR